MRRIRQQHGFTLVELLVVISIIGLLSTVGVVALTSSRRQSRNAKRIADVKQLVTAFGLGLDANGTYPGGSGWRCISASCYGGWSVYVADATTDNFSQPFMANKPADPTDGGSRGQGGYVYNGTGGGSFPVGHLLAYTLEPPATCGPGYLFNTTANFIECVVNLDIN